MIQHVVMWKVKGDSVDERRANTKELAAALQGLSGKIPALQSLELGLSRTDGPQVCDLVLITQHEDWDALNAYQSHPEHQAIAPTVMRLTRERRVVDYERD